MNSLRWREREGEGERRKNKGKTSRQAWKQLRKKKKRWAQRCESYLKTSRRVRVRRGQQAGPDLWRAPSPDSERGWFPVFSPTSPSCLRPYSSWTSRHKVISNNPKVLCCGYIRMTPEDQNMAHNQSDQVKINGNVHQKTCFWSNNWAAVWTRTYVGFGTLFCIVSIVANTCLSVSSQIVALRLDRTVWGH